MVKIELEGKLRGELELLCPKSKQGERRTCLWLERKGRRSGRTAHERICPLSELKTQQWRQAKYIPRRRRMSKDSPRNTWLQKTAPNFFMRAKWRKAARFGVAATLRATRCRSACRKKNSTFHCRSARKVSDWRGLPRQELVSLFGN